MIGPVSGVSFKGEESKDMSSLINSPGKFSTAASAASQAPTADKVELSTTSKKEKSNTAAKIGGTLAALAAVWVGLGIAVGKGKLADWKLPADAADAGWGAKAKDLVYKVGESAKKAYDATLGKWFGKKAADAADEASEAGSKAADEASEAASKTADDAEKAAEEAK